MPRTRRLAIFVNDDEYQLLKTVQEDDVSLGATIRRLALSRANWLAEHSKKQRGNRPIDAQPQWQNTPQTNKQAAGETHYDFSDAQ